MSEDDVFHLRPYRVFLIAVALLALAFCGVYGLTYHFPAKGTIDDPIGEGQHRVQDVSFVGGVYVSMFLAFFVLLGPLLDPPGNETKGDFRERKQ